MKHPKTWSYFVSAIVGKSRVAITAMLAVGAVACGLATPAVANDGTVRVMARNLYQGANLDAIVAATTFPALVAAAGQAVLDVRASRPKDRADAVAREIILNRVDLVGLQEATIIRTGPSNFPPDPLAAVPETTVESDGLQLLLTALHRLGHPFHVVAVGTGIDAQLPTNLGIDARLTGRIAIIARSRGSDLKLSNIQAPVYLRNLSFPTLGGPVINTRGWVAVDVEKDGRRFRFVTTHLEADSAAIRSLQAIDLIGGAGKTGLPLVFVGDFNVSDTTAADSTYGQFLSAGFVDAWTRKRPSHPGFTCCQAPDLRNPTSLLDRRIDLVLFRGAFQVENINLVGDKPADRTWSAPRLWPSDHAGVVATLRIPGN